MKRHRVLSALLAAVLIAAAAPAARASTAWAVVYTSGTDDYKLLTDLEWPDFETKYQDAEKHNLRMVNVRSYLVGNTRRWAAVMRAGTGDKAFIHAKEWTEFQNKVKDHEKNHLRMVSFDVYVENGVRKYSASFLPGDDAKDAIWDKDASHLNQEWANKEKNNLRVVDFRTYVDNGTRLYSVIFRAGTDSHDALVGLTWDELQKQSKPFAARNEVLTNLDIYNDGGQRYYAGIYRQTGKAQWLFIGDKEGIVGATHEWATTLGARPVAITIYDDNCQQSCVNLAIDTHDAGGYSYGLPTTKEHCQGVSSSCPKPTPGDFVVYNWPVDVDGGKPYLRVSALMSGQQFMSLPFNDPQVDQKRTWLYDPGDWHHADDFFRSDHKTFKVLSAAPGKVIFSDYDPWSGNTVIVSHKVGGVEDAYRTIYMHLRNGPDTDCDKAWSKAIPLLQNGVKNATKPSDKAAAQGLLDAYTGFIKQTGCAEKKSERHLDASYWGSSTDLIKVKVGDKPTLGQQLGWSGGSAPGSCGCMPDSKGVITPVSNPNTHLHLFTTYKYPNNSQWYFIDPWGIYATPDCYPTQVTGAPNLDCQEYTPTFTKGRATFP